MSDKEYNSEEEQERSSEEVLVCTDCGFSNDSSTNGAVVESNSRSMKFNVHDFVLSNYDLIDKHDLSEYTVLRNRGADEALIQGLVVKMFTKIVGGICCVYCGSMTPAVHPREFSMFTDQHQAEQKNKNIIENKSLFVIDMLNNNCSFQEGSDDEGDGNLVTNPFNAPTSVRGTDTVPIPVSANTRSKVTVGNNNRFSLINSDDDIDHRLEELATEYSSDTKNKLMTDTALPSDGLMSEPLSQSGANDGHRNDRSTDSEGSNVNFFSDSYDNEPTTQKNIPKSSNAQRRNVDVKKPTLDQLKKESEYYDFLLTRIGQQVKELDAAAVIRDNKLKQQEENKIADRNLQEVLIANTVPECFEATGTGDIISKSKNSVSFACPIKSKKISSNLTVQADVAKSLLGNKSTLIKNRISEINFPVEQINIIPDTVQKRFQQIEYKFTDQLEEMEHQVGCVVNDVTSIKTDVAEIISMFKTLQRPTVEHQAKPSQQPQEEEDVKECVTSTPTTPL